MVIDDFIWLPAVVEKLEVKHRVVPEEVEEVFLRGPRVKFVETGLRPGEDVTPPPGRPKMVAT